MIASITSGATAVVGSIVSTISTLIANENVLALVGLAVGYGIVKYTIGVLPMIRNRR